MMPSVNILGKLYFAIPGKTKSMCLFNVYCRLIIHFSYKLNPVCTMETLVFLIQL